MQRLISLWRTQHGAAQPVPATALGNLGVALIKSGRYPEAVTVLEEALAAILATSKEDSLEVGVTRNNLGEAYLHVHRWTEAERLLRQSIETLEPLGMQEVGDAFDSFAALREAQENWPEAGQLRLRALASWQRNVGDGHTEVVRQMEKLAHVLDRQQRTTERDLYLRRAQEMKESLKCMVS